MMNHYYSNGISSDLAIPTGALAENNAKGIAKHHDTFELEQVGYGSAGPPSSSRVQGIVLNSNTEVQDSVRAGAPLEPSCVKCERGSLVSIL